MPSFEQNKKSKLWSVRFREIDENGITHQKRLSGFRTKKEAQYGYEDYCIAKSANTPRKAENNDRELTFDELLALYYKYQQERVKRSSLYEMQKKIDKRLLPAFTGKKMSEIKPIDILNWQSELSRELSFSYTTSLFSLLCAIYKYGEKYHDIKNITVKVDRPRNTEPKKEMQIWTPEEMSRFLECAEDRMYKTFFLLLYATGCRRGEAEALTWNDIDTEKGEMKISKSLTRKSPTAPWEITTPKNAGSNRTVSLPKKLCQALNEYKYECEKEYKQNRSSPTAVPSSSTTSPTPPPSASFHPQTVERVACSRRFPTRSTFSSSQYDQPIPDNNPPQERASIPNTNFVFGGDRPLSERTTDRYFAETAARAGLKRIRIHDLRHSCASLLISKGASIVAVSRRLGHTNIEQTLNTYSHMLPDDNSKILITLNSVL